MKQLSTLLLICLISLFSCSDNVMENSYPNGQVKERYQVNKEEQKNGSYTLFYEDGKTKEESHYANGVLNGERKLYYPNGNIEIMENYENGVFEGIYKDYHENGKLRGETMYEQGELNGVYKSYYENGQLKEEVSFQKNEENGPFIEYHENGQKKWEGQYLNGDNEFGELKNYDKDGQLIKKMMCDSLAVCRTIWTLEEGDITPEN